MNPLISIVSPEYKGSRMVEELVARIKASVSSITENYEIILVNDGSPDDSWEEISKACAADSRVKGLNLSRNFGQHYAISAGLAYAKGDWVVVMDCDLQDRPEEIPNLYAKALEGWDIVQARRLHKKFGWWKKATSKWYHSVYDWLSGQKTDSAVGNYGIYRNSVINEFNRMPEYTRSFDTLLLYLGFTRTTIDVEHCERAEGSSGYTLAKLLRLAIDTSVANTNKPLKMAVTMGFVMSAISFVLALYNVIAKLCGIITIQGYTTTVFSIWFVGGIILLMLGVVGLYVGKIFDQVKGRQLWIVKDSVNF